MNIIAISAIQELLKFCLFPPYFTGCAKGRNGQSGHHRVPADDEGKDPGPEQGGRDLRGVQSLRPGESMFTSRPQSDCIVGDAICSVQDGNGYIDRRELGLMMKFIGEPVTQEEIDVSLCNEKCSG